MAGGVALNCVANGKIKKENIFENIWIQPAAGDAGGALGAAFGIWHKELKQERLKPIKDNFDDSVPSTSSSVGVCRRPSWSSTPRSQFFGHIF